MRVLIIVALAIWIIASPSQGLMDGRHLVAILLAVSIGLVGSRRAILTKGQAVPTTPRERS